MPASPFALLTIRSNRVFECVRLYYWLSFAIITSSVITFNPPDYNSGVLPLPWLEFLTEANFPFMGRLVSSLLFFFGILAVLNWRSQSFVLRRTIDV